MTQYDIVGIGNAIVDVLAYTKLDFLDKHGLPHGAMQLIDQATAEKIYADMGTCTECSGGSTANTIAGMANLGANTAFIGKVRDDKLGQIFQHDMKSIGVDFLSQPATEGDPTAQCLVLVTEEDAVAGDKKRVERTMATYLGTAANVTEADIDEEAIKNSKVVYFEGYLWDSPGAKAAISKALKVAKENNVTTAFTLSDPFCVDRYREEFLELINGPIDIFFANEHEIESLYQEKDIHKIMYKVSQAGCKMAAVTRGEQGSFVFEGDAIHTVDPVPVDTVFDVTGAGDLYAAGFLYGVVNELSPEQCGKLGSHCAAQVIQYLGGRPMTDLKELLTQL